MLKFFNGQLPCLNKRFLALSVVVPLLMTGCAQTPKTPIQQVPKSVQTSASQKDARIHPKDIKNFKASGKIAARKGNEGNQAQFIWQQVGENFTIKVFGPFGAGAQQIEGSSYGVILKDGDGLVVRGDDAEEVVQKVAGFSLPISGLRYWIKGVPHPHRNIDAMTKDNLGQISLLRQDGWEIRYEHLPAYQGLPQKIKLYRQDVFLKMIIKDWQL